LIFADSAGILTIVVGSCEQSGGDEKGSIEKMMVSRMMAREITSDRIVKTEVLL